MKKINAFFTLLLLVVSPLLNTISSQETTDSIMISTQQVNTKDIVIAQMNYCTNALSNIIHNKSMAVLDYESDQLINNLTMEQACGIYEIKEYRSTLLEAIGQFQITEEERQLMRRIQSLKQDNLKWQALSSALNPTMLLTGGGGMGIQLAYQATLAAARTAIEYKVASNELAIDALEAMWELRKEDLTKINEARVDAQKLILDLFQSHGLSEYDRLTEQNAEALLKYTSETNPQRRIRLLENNKKYYIKYAPYYYHLGMAYVDNNEYHKAKPILKKYLSTYQRTPIFRHDNMSGCVALTTLTHEMGLTKEQKIEVINAALDNLPHNSAAYLQCALAYIYDLKEEEKGLEIILSAIDDPYATDKEILYLGVANLASIINKYPTLQSQIEECMAEESIMHLDTYLLYCINKRANAWEDINQVIHFEKVATRKYESLYIVKNFNRELSVNIPQRFVMNAGACQVVLCDYIKDEFMTEQFVLYNDNYITLEDIEKVACFKADTKLKFLYVEEVGNESQVYVLRNVDIDKIAAGTWPRQSEFALSSEDQKDIVSFCKKYMPEKADYTTWKFDDGSSEHRIYPLDVISVGIGIGVAVSKKYLQEGKLVCFNFGNNISIVYRYDNNNYDLLPCYYQYNDERVFASAEIEKELTENIDVIAGVLCSDSTYGMWGAVKGWVKKDTTSNAVNAEATPVKDEVKQENDSTTNILATVKNWFKKDTTANVQAVEEVQTKNEEESNVEKNDTTSGIFNTIKGWFK